MVCHPNFIQLTVNVGPLAQEHEVKCAIVLAYFNLTGLAYFYFELTVKYKDPACLSTMALAQISRNGV